MTDLGNYIEDGVIDHKFTTIDAVGAPTTLAGTPVVSIYKANGLVQSVAGITLTVNFDGVTGLNHVRVDLSSDSFYAVRNEYHLVITTGTVGGTSVVGYTVAKFSVEADGVATSTQAKLIAWLIESQRLAHTFQGNSFWVDPYNGDTHANGARGGIYDPYSTIMDCYTNQITSSAHDLIFLVAGDPTGVTTLTESGILIAKRYTFFRGPGRDFIITRSDSGDTFRITAGGIELGGVQIETAGTGSGRGIDVNGADFARIHHCWINATRGDGIRLNNANNCQVRQNHLQGAAVGGSGNGIEINGTGGSSNYNHVEDNMIVGTVVGDGIKVGGGVINDTFLCRNRIIGGVAGWGITVEAESTRAIVCDNLLSGNFSGDTVNDSGTDTVDANSIRSEEHTSELQSR